MICLTTKVFIPNSYINMVQDSKKATHSSSKSCPDSVTWLSETALRLRTSLFFTLTFFYETKTTSLFILDLRTVQQEFAAKPAVLMEWSIQ
jgi:hypothetical protein